MRVNAHKDSRYSNTLMVSLNNRIYFREHASSVVHSNHTDSQQRLEAATRHFHQVHQVGSVTPTGFKLDGLSSHAMELTRMKEDVVSFNSEQ